MSRSNATSTKSQTSMKQNQLLPDVKFKPLIFYDVLGELLKPTKLITAANSFSHGANISFRLTWRQIKNIEKSKEEFPGRRFDYTHRILLRMCLLEANSEQGDCFPPNLSIKVNSKMCLINDGKSKDVWLDSLDKPVDITNLCFLTTLCNQILIKWTSEFSKLYAIGIYLVKKLTPETLLQRIEKKGVSNANQTKKMIKLMLAQDDDSEVAMTKLQVSLRCPLSKLRLQIPCRAVTCSHVLCFEALLYLQLNEKKPSWICPVCHKPAPFNSLKIDGLFSQIIKSAPKDCNEVEFHKDGSWTFVVDKSNNIETFVLGSNLKKRSLVASPSNQKPKKVIVITINSSDEEEDEDEDGDNGLSNGSLPIRLSYIVSSDHCYQRSKTNVQFSPERSDDDAIVLD